MRKRLYSPCSIVCHGASEVKICEFLRQDYRLRICDISNKKGTHNIEITSLLNFLNASVLKTKESYIRYVGKDFLQFDEDGNIINHKIFIMMDVDGYYDEAEKFANKKMFKGHWAYKYIVPILSNPNLDESFNKAGYKINSHESKPKQYLEFLSKNKLKYKEIFKYVSNFKTNIFDLVEWLDKYCNN